MKKLLCYVFAFLIIFKINEAHAQDAAAPIHIAIIPFTASGNYADTRSITDAVENIVSSCFANKDRFFLLDRGVTEKLKAELDAAKDNSSVYAKVVAKQGHLAGAEYIITGVVDPIDIGETTSVNYLTRATTTKYHGSLRLAVSLIKVETGRVFYSEPIIARSNDFDNKTSSDITDNALCFLKSYFQTVVRKQFPNPIFIIGVEKEKKGLPEKVRVNSGSEMFDNGKQAACGNVVTSLFHKKIYLEVYTDNNIVAGGRSYATQHVVGTLKVETIEGETTICSVSSGAEEIKALMDKNVAPLVRIQAN